VLPGLDSNQQPCG